MFNIDYNCNFNMTIANEGFWEKNRPTFTSENSKCHSNFSKKIPFTLFNDIT